MIGPETFGADFFASFPQAALHLWAFYIFMN